MISGIYEHVVSLQDGFDTLVGDRGAKLSGGQKQRVAIARAILKDADLIILDETTSGLDSDSEKMVFDRLVEIYRDKTMIFISHRISTVKNVDERSFACTTGKLLIKFNERGGIKKNFHNSILLSSITESERLPLNLFVFCRE